MNPTNKIVMADADILVALAYKNDANHQRATTIAQQLSVKVYDIFFPNTAILEAITALKRALNKADLADLINKQYQQGTFNVIYIDDEIQQAASRLFGQKARSKQNTIFDAMVAVTAKKYSSDGIFSFDGWYPKIGMKLIQDVLATD